jgi:hypothetical protein
MEEMNGKEIEIAVKIAIDRKIRRSLLPMEFSMLPRAGLRHKWMATNI